MKKPSGSLAEAFATGVAAVVLFILFIAVFFFLVNGIAAGFIWLILTYGFMPMFPQFEQYMLSFWQIFWAVAVLRAIKGIFAKITTNGEK